MGKVFAAAFSSWVFVSSATAQVEKQVPPVLTQTQSRAATAMAKDIDNLFLEAQSRRGGTLDARLTQMWQAFVLYSPDIAAYSKKNLTRRGALIYVRASGESGEKTVRFFLYKSGGEEMDGKILKNIKEWFLPLPVAQAAARDITGALSSHPAKSYNCAMESGLEKVEIVLSPKTGRALKNPLLGESLSQK